jgi:1-acyl-sn-glycerol-3-phosphate acyltransferase
LADNALRMFVVLQIVRSNAKAQDSAWHLANVFYYLPFIMLAPVNGAIGNELPKRWVLMGSAAYCFSLTALLISWADGLWIWCAGLSMVMVGAAIFSPARYAILPAAAHDCRLPLTRVNAFIEMGATIAGVTGLLLALYWGQGVGGMPDAHAPTLSTLLIANLVCLLGAIPVRFASDVRRPESASQAVEGFFHDFVRIWRFVDARDSLLMLAGFWGLLIAGSGAIFAFTHTLDLGGRQISLLQPLLMVAAGTATGAILGGVQGHPRRALGLVPLGGLGMLAGLAWAGLSRGSMAGPGFAVGFMAGIVLVPLRAAYQGAVPADARGNALAISNTANYLMVILLALPIYTLSESQPLAGSGQVWLIAAWAAMGALVSGFIYFREILELITELLIWPLYRIRGCGPGLDDFPSQGPVLVVANHGAWLDPLWIAKVLPRRITPMMTSVFYDRPVLRWLMVNVVRAIRVEASEFKREAPELRQAIAALDRGECVVVFPEGRMRRQEDQILRRFGQGIWHILHERPNTPVVPCWIEGSWGSYFSYRGGPPMRNKEFDRWRRIDIAVSEPRVLEPTVLEDHRATRTHLMQACLKARRHLGLEAPPVSPLILEEAPSPE